MGAGSGMDAMRGVVLALFALVALALPLAAAPAAAPARPLVGIGDQKPAMFDDPRFAWLHVRYARLVVSWDVAQRGGWERPWVDAWLRKARAAGVRPLIAFGHAWSGPRRSLLPSVAAYRRAFAAFRRRYPWIRDYSPWNEANHCSQPTCHRPERAAAYYDAVRAACRGCQIVAADVLDQPNMERWLRAFRRATTGHPRLWGLHNYLDANRMRSSGTRRLLAAVPGRVWFTETGGIVRRRHYHAQITFTESPGHAATATTWILKLADRHPRVKRVYLYQWNADSLANAWDSGLIDPFDQARPAFDVLARARGRDPRRAPGVRPTPPAQQSPVPSPPADQPPAEPQPPPDPQPQPEPQPQPQPQPTCVLLVICR